MTPSGQMLTSEWKSLGRVRLCDSVDWILQARILELAAFPFSGESSQTRDRTKVSCITGRFFTNWAITETLKTCTFSSASVQFSGSVMSHSLRLHCCSTPGFPVHHQLPELAQTHIHWTGDAIQPSHPLSSSSPPIFNQGPFQWVSSFHQVAKVVEFQLQHQSYQWTPRTDLL